MTFTIKKLLKMIGILIGGLIISLILVGVLFVNFSPEFGAKATEEQKTIYSSSSNYKNGVFENLGGVTMNLGFSDYSKMIRKYFSAQPNSIPDWPLPLEKIDSLEIVEYNFESPKITWFGHSTVLLQINQKNILIDPMFGPVPAPHPKLGNPRFNLELPIEIEKLPKIDAVIFSHDHYDHLDYGSILKLKGKVGKYFTPLGVGNHLKEWGVDESLITELDWWDEVKFSDLQLICTPAQHFSGRGLSDRGATLWSSWVVKSEEASIFFSGDSGYGDHFTEIGEKYGPFDFAMLECGQYNELWKEIHMMPEETAQASLDLKAKLMMPIHWGSFKLALHPWDDPIVRVTKMAEELGVAVSTPKIGEQVIIKDSVEYPNSKWWIEND